MMLLLNPTHIKLCWPSCLIKQSRQWTRHLQFMNQMFYSATMIYSRTFTDDEQRCLTFCLTHTHTHTHTHTYTRTVWITRRTHVQGMEWNYSLQGQQCQCDGLHKWPICCCVLRCYMCCLPKASSTASITVTTATIALWLKHRMKHI